LTTHY